MVQRLQCMDEIKDKVQYLDGILHATKTHGLIDDNLDFHTPFSREIMEAPIPAKVPTAVLHTLRGNH